MSVQAENLEGILGRSPDEGSPNSQHSKDPVIDAEKNIFTSPLIWFVLRDFMLGLFFSPKVKTDNELGAEKQQRGQAAGWTGELDWKMWLRGRKEAPHPLGYQETEAQQGG